MNSALDIAKYVVNKCTKDESPVSNLQLQKILYYLQREFLQNSDEPLFFDEIEAWRFGPVVPIVYEHYCGFAALPILLNQDLPLEVIDQTKCEIINSIVDEKRVRYPWDLVRDTHLKGKAWDLTFYGDGDHTIISKELIKTNG